MNPHPRGNDDDFPRESSSERVIRGRTISSVVLDNTLYDKGLSNISGTHPIITELIKDYSPI